MTLWSHHFTSHMTVRTCALQKSNLNLGVIMAPKKTDVGRRYDSKFRLTTLKSVLLMKARAKRFWVYRFWASGRPTMCVEILFYRSSDRLTNSLVFLEEETHSPAKSSLFICWVIWEAVPLFFVVDSLHYLKRGILFSAWQTLQNIKLFPSKHALKCPKMHLRRYRISKFTEGDMAPGLLEQ